MNQIVDKFKKSRVLFLAIGSTVAMILYAQFILGYYSSCFSIAGTSNSLGLTFGYDLQIVQHFFEIRSTEQLICYAQFIRIWDSIFPVIYTLMYTFWFVYLFKKWHLLIIIPLLHLFSDWIENYIELLMLEEFMIPNTLSESLVSLGSDITIIKWCLSIVTYAIIIFGIISKLKQHIASKSIKNDRLN